MSTQSPKQVLADKIKEFIGVMPAFGPKPQYKELLQDVAEAYARSVLAQCAERCEKMKGQYQITAFQEPWNLAYDQAITDVLEELNKPL